MSAPKHLLETAPEGTGRAAVTPGERGRRAVAQSQSNHLRLSGADAQAVMRGRLGPLLLRVDDPFLAEDEVVVDAVLDVGTAARDAEDPLRVRLVFREQDW